MNKDLDLGAQHQPNTQGRNRIRSLGSWLFALIVGLVGTWQFHIVQFASRFDIFPGDRGDARLVSYLLEHWYQVFRGSESWLSPPMFYPVKGVLGYADLLIGYAIPFSILRASGLGIFESSEFTIILFNFLNYLICFVLLKKILRFNTFAAAAGAAFFAFNSPKLVQLGHLQLQPLLFLPLAIIFIVLLVQRADSLNQKKAFALLSLAALSLDLQLHTGFYPGWFFIFWCFLFLVLAFLFSDTRSFLLSRLRRFWPAFTASLLVFVFGLVPFLAAYVPVIQSSGGRSYEEVKPLIPVFWSLLVMGEGNYVWGGLAAAVKHSHPLHPELQIGIGLVPSLTWLGLTIFAVWLIKTNQKKIARAGNDYSAPRFAAPANLQHMFIALLILATTLFYIIGMRYGQDHSPWVFVYFGVPGAQGIRAVARYVISLALPMAIAFAFLIHYAMARISVQKSRTLRVAMFAALLVTVTFGLVEQFATKKDFNGFSVRAENEYLKKQAAALPDNCSSFYVAVGPYAAHNQFEYQIDAVFLSIMRHVPTLNGYSGQLPPGWSLWEVKAPDYEANVKKWIEKNHIGGNVCRFLIDETPTSALEDAGRFVRQQYLDLLAREPDPIGFEQGVRQLAGCGAGSNPNCDRAYIVGGILSSAEFRDRSYFVYRLYDATLGRLPRYDEFMADRQGIVASQNEAEEAASKDKLINDWVERAEFKARYGALTDTAYVDKLLATAGVALPNRDELIADLTSRRKTRAEVLRAVLESPEVSKKFYNRAFVATQFFGFLRRDPRPEEFSQCLRTLEASGDYRQVINDFINSTEYRRRLDSAQ